MHHGQFTTAREAVEAHKGEALAQRMAFEALSAEQQNALEHIRQPRSQRLDKEVFDNINTDLG